jgi:haloalkane dehalogenase
LRALKPRTGPDLLDALVDAFATTSRAGFAIAGIRSHSLEKIYKAQFPTAPVVELPQAGHFCQEDAPETLVALIQQFIQHPS